MHHRSQLAARHDRAQPAAARDPLLDLLRSAALLVVVLWHWAFSTVRWGEQGPHVGNPVGVTPGMWLLTWLGQVMPLFFLVGGALHARSLSGGSASGFVRRRLRRLVAPAVPLLVPAAALLVVTELAGRPAWTRAIVLVVSPLWFLAVYVVCALLAPFAQRLDQRFGWRAVLGGLAATVLIGHLRFAHGWVGPAMMLSSFLVVWATVHQMGWSLERLWSGPRSRCGVVALVGLGGMVIGVASGLPAAMVGVPGERVSNMGPPTVMVPMLALLQLGVLGLVAPSLRAVAERNRRRLAWIGEQSMTVFLWHLLAFVLFWLLVITVAGPVGHRIDGRWWLERPVWVLGPAAFAVPLCALTRRFERRERVHGFETVP